MKGLELRFIGCSGLSGSEKRKVRKAVEGVISDMLEKCDGCGSSCMDCPYNEDPNPEEALLGCAVYNSHEDVFEISRRIAVDGREYAFGIEADYEEQELMTLRLGDVAEVRRLGEDEEEETV